MNTGKLQRRWSIQKPDNYDAKNGYVRMDIISAPGIGGSGSEIVQGYSYLEVQIDGVIDYGHIKSQLIEAGYTKNDEIALSVNAMRSFLKIANASSSWASFKNSISEDEDIRKFNEFNEYRTMCGVTAYNIWELYNHSN